jgi:catechol 2,3-dioxygenase-like lactoylglutathione lyase family enzyme
MSIEVNGIAHIQMTVNDPATGVPFWEDLCHFLGMKTLIRAEEIVYCIGSRTGILVRGAPEGKERRRFDQDTAGLHHLCFRARSREDVDQVHGFVSGQQAARIVHAPKESDFAPGYYSLLFEDPDGIRVEINYVPGKGHFGAEGRLASEGQGAASEYDEAGLHGGAKE